MIINNIFFWHVIIRHCILSQPILLVHAIIFNFLRGSDRRRFLEQRHKVKYQRSLSPTYNRSPIVSQVGIVLNDNVTLLQSCSQSGLTSSSVSFSNSDNLKPVRSKLLLPRKTFRPEASTSKPRQPSPLSARKVNRQLGGLSSPSHRRTVSNAETSYRDNLSSRPEKVLSQAFHGKPTILDRSETDNKGVSRSHSFFQAG